MSTQEQPGRTGLIGTIAGFFNLRRDELLPALIAALFFFCVLCGYNFVRPVRDAFGVERGMDQLLSLFIATMIASLALNPVFSWLVGRLDRRVFLPLVYGTIVLMMLGFAAFRAAAPEEWIGIWTGRVFFVWLSVVNLFMTGLFWALMADCFGPAEAKRIFPSVAVGGTLGALIGSAAAWALSNGKTFDVLGYELFDLRGLALSPSQMIVLSAVFIAISAILSIVLSKVRPATPRALSESIARSTLRDALDGMRLTARSPYLLGICSYIGLMAVCSTFLYFTKNKIALEAAGSKQELIGAFATIDFWTQLTTLVLQLTLTARIIRMIGVGWTLVVMPVVLIGSFAVLAVADQREWSPVAMLLAITIIQSANRATRYAITRPARETLFTVVSRDEKYKAKSLADTFIYRAGDTTGALVYVATATLTALAVTVAPIAIVMAGLGLYLGARQKSLSVGEMVEDDAGSSN